MVKIFVEYGTPMRLHRLAKLVPALLTVIGSIALASGLFVAVITMTRTPANHRGIGLSNYGAIYVGADTCYTCHKDQPHDWLLELNAQPATSPVANPQAAVVDVRIHDALPQPEMKSATSANVLADQVGQISQHYIIATESDPALLPGQWTPQKNPPVGCNDCHTLSPAAEIAQIKAVELNCSDCHSQHEDRVNRVWGTHQPHDGIGIIRMQYG
ncbi:MAG: hypothetical protein ABI700_07155 [Chloroflexota bacterium]